MNRKQDFLEIVVIITATPATSGDRELIIHTFQNIQNDMTYHRQSFPLYYPCACASDLRAKVTSRHQCRNSQHPNGFWPQPRILWDLPERNIVMGFFCSSFPLYYTGFHHPDAAQVTPLPMQFQEIRVGTQIILPRLYSPVSFFLRHVSTRL